MMEMFGPPEGKHAGARQAMRPTNKSMGIAPKVMGARPPGPQGAFPVLLDCVGEFGGSRRLKADPAAGGCAGQSSGLRA